MVCVGGQKGAWERAGEMTECGRELQLWGRDGFYVTPGSEGKAWQRQEEETEQVELFFPSIPQATSLTTNLSLKPLGCHGNRME